MINSERPPIDEDSLPKLLHAGMGRAVHYLLQEDLRQYRDIILDEALHNRIFDPQTECKRAEYLYSLIKHSGEEDYYREKIIDALVDVTDCADALQLFDFAVIFAEAGYERAREVAYQKFAKNDTKYEDYCGDYALIRIDGINGLLYVLDVLGAAEYEDYISQWLIEEAEGIAGADEVHSALVKAAAENKNIAAALSIANYPYSPSFTTEEVLLVREHIMRVDSQSRREGLEELTWEEAKKVEPTKLGFWAKQAPEEELIKVAEELIGASSPKDIKTYLRMFMTREFPLEPIHLMAFLDSEDEFIQNRARKILSDMEYPEVRRLFFEWYEQPEKAWRAVRFLKENYAPGDYEFIETLLNSEKDPDSLHTICCDTLDVFKENPLPELLPALMLVYNQSPCSMCRASSVESMHSISDLPEWLIEESVYDADDGLRVLAQSLI
ncbi:MAG: hypothetical protein ABFD64_05335 [Armatimonadota bacterium]